MNENTYETKQQKDQRTTNRMRNIDLGINLDLQEENMKERKGKDNKIQTNTEGTKKLAASSLPAWSPTAVLPGLDRA